MLLLVPALIAFGLALLQGGSVRHLAELRLRGIELIMLSLVIQLLLYVPSIRASAFVAQWGSVIYIGAMCLTLTGALRNWNVGAAVRIATLGLALNAMVIVLNGGRMPVNAQAMRYVQGQTEVGVIANRHLYGNTQLAGRATRLAMLSDIIPIYLPGERGNVYSVGDVLLTSGIAMLVYRTTRRSAVSST